ncbi:hypothetical protein [Pseudoalteromonas tetraodonis]|uniref:hypothetical protein n=1 Tax=Pseudoalteromonas tetraodonis TaxID=43659 RepID=UPI003D061FAC
MIDINNPLSIGSFLNFGYDITYTPSIKFDYSQISSNAKKPDYKTTKDIFMSCLERCIGDTNDDIVVPISGGLDSRALLAGLLELRSAEKIKTYTFGTKSSYDFEIGKSISKKLGVTCNSYELSEYNFDESSLYATASMFDYQTTLFYHPPYDEIKNTFNSDLVLVGFMGDPLAGSHLPKVASIDNEQLFQKFIKKNQMVRSCSLYDFEAPNLSEIVKFPELVSSGITKDEYLDFEVRQLRYVYPHVMPKQLNCKSPFIEADWFNHMLSLPIECRMEQSYYNEFLINAFPVAFNLPCKNNYGLKLNTNPTLAKLWRGMHRFNTLKEKTVNYQNFNRRICDDKALYNLLDMLLTKLATRDLGLKVNPIDVLRNHKNHNAIYADAIINMSSLEINLSSVD